jgi:uncharacterized protein YukE
MVTANELKKQNEALLQKISDLESHVRYLQSGVDYWKKRSEEYENAYQKTDAQLQNLINDMIAKEVAGAKNDSF